MVLENRTLGIKVGHNKGKFLQPSLRGDRLEAALLGPSSASPPGIAALDRAPRLAAKESFRGRRERPQKTDDIIVSPFNGW